MSSLREYLVQKRAAFHALKARDPASVAPIALTARASAEGRSGIRRIRIRHHQVISDSPANFAGYDLGPASPELLIGSLSSCLTHSFLIQAADLQIPLDRLEVEVEATQDPRAGQPGFEHIPIYPHDIRYTIHIASDADDSDIARLHQQVEKACPILNLLQHPQSVQGKLLHHTP